jgi:hypothetical protein
VSTGAQNLNAFQVTDKDMHNFRIKVATFWDLYQKVHNTTDDQKLIEELGIRINQLTTIFQKWKLTGANPRIGK